MKEKEKIFCRIYAKTQNDKEAAIGAGFSALRAHSTAQKLLLRDDIKNEIQNCLKECRQTELLMMAAQGLKRLAFCKNNDVLKCALNQDDYINIDELDLFGVSEFKLKDGSLECKFVDRTKVFETLANISQNLNDGEQSQDFLQAFIKSAKEQNVDE